MTKNQSQALAQAVVDRIGAAKAVAVGESGGFIAKMQIDAHTLNAEAAALLAEHLRAQKGSAGDEIEVCVVDNHGAPIVWPDRETALSYALELKRTAQQKFSFSFYSKTGISLAKPPSNAVRFLK